MANTLPRVPVRLGALRTTIAASPVVALHNKNQGGDGAAIFAASAARVCRVCAQHAARYTCPRCNAPYCGVPCFQRHGDACTERFYESLVRDTAALDGGNESKKMVGELLARVKRFQDEAEDTANDAAGSDDDSDSEAEQDAAERLEALALADEQQLTLDALTPAQRRQFLAEVADGRLGKFVQLWEPWWRLDPRVYARETAGRRKQLVIEEISSSPAAASVRERSADTAESDGQEELAPGAVLIASGAFPAEIFTDASARAMPASLEPLLRGRSPAPALRFHLAEVLFSYALVLRTFNGDWQQAADEAATLLLHLSAVLTSADAKYDAAERVLHACLRKQVDVAYDGSSASGAASSASIAVNQQVVRDVTRLLACRVFALDALSDALAMLGAAKQQLLAGSARSRKRDRQAAKRLELVAKKLQFFQTWVFHTPESRLEATARELEHAAAAVAAEASR
ncbi:hypothetical protein PybrP1_006296 [[Pythium] brassicae (nom. inval.)]|nr:hypothetical protein PybrP1_006296 [[Pythium] brassicae (nom. inval.)]